MTDFTTASVVFNRVSKSFGAKQVLCDVSFEVPAGQDFTTRLGSVLEVLYLVFNEGYAATSGADWARPDLCAEALRLGRVLAELTPGEAEVHGLVALMEVQASRLRARTGSDGAPVLLLDQDRARWDHTLIRRGLAALDRAERTGAALGPYALQASIAACHARARTAEGTDWVRIAALYEALAGLTPSPVVELNRAVAVSMATARRPGSIWSTSSPAFRRCGATTCCPASAATFWRGWAGRPRPGGSSSGRRN